MDTVISLLVLSSLTKLVVPQDTPLASFSAVVELVTKEQRVFSGESVRLRCSVSDERSKWSYLWFRGSEKLPQTEQELVLWKARVQESGKYYCQGWRDTVIGNVYTLQSLPVEIKVDGGWAVLQYQPHPGLVGDTVQITCRVRLNPQLEEVFLYKDGVEVMRQTDPHFHLTNATLNDQGDYSCRASWDINRQTRAVISSDVPVQVLEVLTQPLLEIVSVSKDKMKLICHLQYNARAPAPPINYYFYKNDNRLGVATSENQKVVPKAPGMYSCRAKVPQLGIFRWSEPTKFGQVPGQMMRPQPDQRRDPRPSAPKVSSPDLSLSAGAGSSTDAPGLSDTSASLIQIPKARTQHSNHFPTPSQPQPTL